MPRNFLIKSAAFIAVIFGPAAGTAQVASTTAGRRSWAYGIARISEWHSRARSRRELRGLAERELGDIGLTRCDARAEASKWFWQH